jgi:hypothetical protein
MKEYYKLFNLFSNDSLLKKVLDSASVPLWKTSNPTYIHQPSKAKSLVDQYMDANDQIMYHLGEAQRLTSNNSQVIKILDSLGKPDKVKEVKAGNKKIASFVTLFGQMPLDI